MNSVLMITIVFLLAVSVYADDPGARDSIIVETVFAELGDTAVDVRIYVTSDDSIGWYSFPLAWSPNSGNGIYPIDVTDYNIISHWFEHFDSVLYDDGFIRMIGWIDNAEPPLITYNFRLHCWTVHFAIDSLADAQIVAIDTTYDPINGSLLFGLFGGILQFAPDFTPGAIFYGITSDASDMTQPLPRQINLFQNYPNPFNAFTVIRYYLPEDGHVSVTIYDLLGRRVRTLVDAEEESGTHSVTFKDYRFPSGIYFYVLKFDGQTMTKKMQLLK